MRSLILRSLLVLLSALLPLYRVHADQLALWDFTGPEEESYMDISVWQGYRRDNLYWRAAGKHHNRLTDMHFKNIKIYSNRVAVKWFAEDYFAKLDVAYGLIHGGQVRSRNFHYHNHDSTETKWHNVPGNYTFDTTFRTGLNYYPTMRWRVAPQVGYSLFQQKFRFKHGRPLIEHLYHPLGVRYHHRLKHVRGTYRTRWYGPQAGVQVETILLGETCVCQSVSAYTDYSFLFVPQFWGYGFQGKQRGRLHQHARPTKSFGHLSVSGLNWQIFDNWALRFEYEFMKLYAKRGRNMVGHPPGHPRTEFHKANRTASDYRLAIVASF